MSDCSLWFHCLSGIKKVCTFGVKVSYCLPPAQQIFGLLDSHLLVTRASLMHICKIQLVYKCLYEGVHEEGADKELQPRSWSTDACSQGERGDPISMQYFLHEE